MHPRGTRTRPSLSPGQAFLTRSREPPPASWRPGPRLRKPALLSSASFSARGSFWGLGPLGAQGGKVAIRGLNPMPGSSGRGGVQARALVPEGWREARRGRSGAQNSPGETKCGGGNPGAYPRTSTAGTEPPSVTSPAARGERYHHICGDSDRPQSKAQRERSQSETGRLTEPGNPAGAASWASRSHRYPPSSARLLGGQLAPGAGFDPSVPRRGEQGDTRGRHELCCF